MRQMNRRILFVIGTLDVGGAETHLVRVARELKSRGWTPEIFVLTPGGQLTKELIRAGIPIRGIVCAWCRWLPVGRALIQSLATMASLVRAMRQLRPAICHFFLPAAYLFGGFAAALSGTRPCIMSRRSLRDYQENHPLLAILEHRLHRRMDRVCGNSRAVIAQLAVEGVPRERLRLIYNGIAIAPVAHGLRGAVRQVLGIESDVFVIIIVANLIPYKGHEDLIDALSLIHRDLPQPWLLLAAGRDDGIGERLAQRVEECGLTGNVKWLGVRTDVPRLLAAADLAVLPSHQEGFSNAIIEAMAAGLPMVVTDVGGNAEAVVDGRTGYVVPSHNPAALADAIRLLALDPQRVAFGERGRQRVAQHFSLSACIDAYEALYREVGAA